MSLIWFLLVSCFSNDIFGDISLCQGSYFDATWSFWKDSVCFIDLSNRLWAWGSSYYCTRLVIENPQYLEEVTWPNAWQSELLFSLWWNVVAYPWIWASGHGFYWNRPIFFPASFIFCILGKREYLWKVVERLVIFFCLVNCDWRRLENIRNFNQLYIL